jgi:hypothetical protein
LAADLALSPKLPMLPLALVELAGDIAICVCEQESPVMDGQMILTGSCRFDNVRVEEVVGVG